jgi:hypothetical protein
MPLKRAGELKRERSTKEILALAQSERYMFRLLGHLTHIHTQLPVIAAPIPTPNTTMHRGNEATHAPLDFAGQEVAFSGSGKVVKRRDLRKSYDVPTLTMKRIPSNENFTVPNVPRHNCLKFDTIPPDLFP